MKFKLTLALGALALSAALLVSQSGNAQTQVSCASVDGTVSTNWTDGNTVKSCTNTSSARAANMQSTLKAIDALQVSSPSGPVDADIAVRLRQSGTGLSGITFYLFHEGDDYLSGAFGGPTYIDPQGLVRNQVGDSITGGSERYSVIFEKLYLRNKQNDLINHTTAHELGHHADAIYVGGSFSVDTGALLGGTITPGDKLKLTVTDARLSGPIEIKYTVQGDDTFDSITKKLAKRINSDSSLSSVGIKAVDLPFDNGINSGLRLGSFGGGTNYVFATAGVTETMTFGMDQRTTFSDSALFAAALDADIRGMNKSNPCSIMISDPDLPEEPPVQQDGLFTNAKDDQGNWICGAPGSAGTTPIYSGNNLQIAVKAWPALYPKNPDTGQRKPEELFAEEFSVIVGFPDTLTDTGGQRDGSDNFIGGGSPLSPFTCTYLVVKSLVENGSYPSDLGSYSYVEHQGTTNKATLHKCNGSSENITIPIGS